jgi:hypothetical protein
MHSRRCEAHVHQIRQRKQSRNNTPETGKDDPCPGVPALICITEDPVLPGQKLRNDAPDAEEENGDAERGDRIQSASEEGSEVQWDVDCLYKKGCYADND